MKKNNRVTIICGHYGAGKTTFSINYAIYLRKQTEKPIYIADLDVVNPYFRSREHAQNLKDKDIIKQDICTTSRNHGFCGKRWIPIVSYKTLKKMIK